MMRRFLISLLIIISTLLVFFSVAQCAKAAEFAIIYPVDGLILGGEFSQGIGDMRPYLGLVYDFKNNLPLYRVGCKFYRTDMTLDFNYGLWLNLNIPNYYYYQKGVAASLIWDKGIDDYTQLTAFDGEVDHTGKDATTGIYYIYYLRNKSLYLKGTTQVKFIGDVTLGQVIAEKAFFYAADLKLPIKFNYFKIYPTLGYVKPTDTLKSHYDLTYYVPGFAYQTRKGNCLTALTLEEQFPIYEKVFSPISLYVSAFVDTGDVFDEPAEFKLHSDIGVGLVINVGIGLVRLDEIMTDEGNWSFVARTQIAF